MSKNPSRTSDRPRVVPNPKRGGWDVKKNDQRAIKHFDKKAGAEEYARLIGRKQEAGRVVQPAPSETVYVSFSAEIIPKTTEPLLGLFAGLVNDGVKNVYLLLSTPGGHVMSGLNLYNVLRGLPIHLTTHNVGNVDSIGNVVFLAGEERYSCPNATFMFHGVGFDVKQPERFEEKSLRERLSSIEADQERIGSIIVERTTVERNEVRQLFLEAVTRDPGFALERGFIHEVRDLCIPDGATVKQLVFPR